ncbi:hypothetical protein B0H21DRAFT_777899 [Amylocystis lapponica]|nr:hypothetical protein B0H21DRAFT_777899 [Amylocystis lapponica]
MASDGQRPSYACACLNVRIYPQLPPGGPPPSNGSSECDPVYVGEVGLSVAHIQVTLRSRSRILQEQHGETSQSIRYTSLTCLFCHTLVYRSREGPVMPTDDWAEQEMLKSSTGWIEVYKSCLTRDTIVQAEDSSLYSKTFSIVVPPRSSLPPSPVTPSSPLLPEPSPPNAAPQIPRMHLPQIPPLFPPPPFSSSHPVFVHLATIASAESEKVRSSAEDYLAEIVRTKVAEIQVIEAELKKDVELLWRKYRECAASIGQDNANHVTSPSRRRPSSGKWTGLASESGHGLVNGTSSSIRISDFEPIGNPPQRRSSVASPQEVTSALSASLASSSFQYPRAQQDINATSSRHPAGDSHSRSSSRSGTVSTGRSSTTRVVSPSTASSRTIAMGINGDSGSMRDVYRRNMDESKDITTSFRYVLDLEAQMNAMRAQADDDVQEGSSVELPNGLNGTAVLVRSPRIGTKSSMKHAHTNGAPKSPSKVEVSAGTAARDTEDPSTKTKRKVTFDVKPDVAIIEESAEGEGSGTGAEEAIFDMEGERQDSAQPGEESPEIPSLLNSKTTTPTPESPTRSRSASTSSLPSPFASLRPASLPTFSNVRPPPREAPEERPRSEVVRDAVLSAKAEGKRPAVNGHHEDDPETLDPREAEILRLVAASTPSHRSAWKRDSKAWQLFVNRQDKKPRDVDQDAIVEEEEGDAGVEYRGPRLGYPIVNGSDSTGDEERDDAWTLYNGPPIATSLPIAIAQKHSFGIPSYQLKTSLTDRPGVLVPQFHTLSSTAMRRAAYAERDRSRSIDPGALDFAPDEGDEDDEDDAVDTSVGGRARQRALRILQARNEVPEAGMWRSLA